MTPDQEASTTTMPTPTTTTSKTAASSAADATDATDAAASRGATELLLLKPTDVATHHRNPRTDLGDLDDLAKSIEEHGILEPLVVAPWPATIKATAAQKKKHLLIAGHRRLAAATKAKVSTVPCIVRADLDTEDKQLEAMLVENLHRADLSPVEEANAYQALLEFPGFTQTSVAKQVGQPVSRVRDRLKLVKLDPTVQKSLHTGQLTITDALAVGEFHDDPKTTKELLAQAGSDRFGFALQRARRLRVEADVLAARLVKLEAAGIKVRKSLPDKATDLVDAFPSWRGLKLEYRGDGPERDAFVLKHHQECPGHYTALVKERYGDGMEIVHGCTQAKLHPTKVLKTRAELDRAAKERQQKAALKIDLAAAADVRREFFRAQVAEPSIDIARGVLVGKVLAPTYGGWENEKDKAARLQALADLLPGQVSPDPDSLRQALDRFRLEQLAVVLDILHNRTDEAQLAKPELHYYGTGGDWIRRLDQVYRYPWTPVEKKRYKSTLNQPAPSQPPADAATDAREPDGEAGSDGIVADATPAVSDEAEAIA